MEFDKSTNKIKLNSLITFRYTELFIGLSKISFIPIYKFRLIIETRISPSIVKDYFEDTTGTYPIYITTNEFINLEHLNKFLNNWLIENKEKLREFQNIFGITLKNN